jgi:hypothetical protein
MSKPTNAELVLQVVALAWQMHPSTPPIGPDGPGLDGLAAQIERGLERGAFLDDLMRELRGAGLHVNPAALSDAPDPPGASLAPPPRRPTRYGGHRARGYHKLWPRC